MDEAADIIVITGQGVWAHGSFYVEYPDRDVYLEHAANARTIVARYRYSHAVLSGGYTQPSLPNVSEAEGLWSLFQDMDVWPLDKERIILDPLALDSAENIVLGLMAARLRLGRIPVRRIGVWASWKFKKPRFNLLARELGIQDRFFFHGCASYEDADAGARARQGEEDQFKL